jgi:hypothetical protein
MWLANDTDLVDDPDGRLWLRGHATHDARNENVLSGRPLAQVEDRHTGHRIHVHE